MKRHFRVWRGDAEGGEINDYDVEVNEGEVVLDIIHRLQATQAPDLACRWNCKAGKCGSCSMEINGKPRLGCMTRMSTFTEDETVTITPLRTFPVIRDLVTDVSFNYAKARETPAFAPPAGVAPGAYRMHQVDVDRSQEFRKCIECFLCQNTCHVVRDHEENKTAFSGPRVFIRAAELDMHPLDARGDRKEHAQAAQGLGFCNITKCCTEVCPEHIKITDNAIIPMKERVVDRRYDPLVWLGSKIFRRSESGAAPGGSEGSGGSAAAGGSTASGGSSGGAVSPGGALSGGAAPGRALSGGSSGGSSPGGSLAGGSLAGGSALGGPASGGSLSGGSAAGRSSGGSTVGPAGVPHRGVGGRALPYDGDPGGPAAPPPPPLGDDGRMEVAEILAPHAGGPSPFGDDQHFPLPSVTYRPPEPH